MGASLTRLPGHLAHGVLLPPVSMADYRQRGRDRRHRQLAAGPAPPEQQADPTGEMYMDTMGAADAGGFTSATYDYRYDPQMAAMYSYEPTMDPNQLTEDVAPIMYPEMGPAATAVPQPGYELYSDTAAFDGMTSGDH